jgi:lipopolysaccharide/colanic/teichoic acid biosynthesis glycosyltransferase
MHFPALRGSFRFRFSPVDVMWAAVSPPIALYLRAVPIGTPAAVNAVELYCLIAFTSSLIAFLFFRIRDGIVHHFSVHDALEVTKAVVVSELLTTLALFTAVRLDGIPRSTPVIHALILAAGLIVYRVVIRTFHDDGSQAPPPSRDAPDHIVMIGCTRLSLLYMKILKTYSAQKYKVVALLDANPRTVGRSVDGIRVVGPPEQLDSIIQEYEQHGIAINRVIAGGDQTLLSPETMDEVQRACTAHDLNLEFVPSLVGLSPLQTAPVDIPAVNPLPVTGDALPLYFRFRRVVDFFVALILIVLFLPLMLVVAGIVLLDIGSPVLFWQQRVGLGGRSFLLYKFRTLKPLFNERGLPIGLTDRMSWAGAAIRKLRLDELPQLLSVLVGDMALIGPRPLLPQDQPSDPTIRLMVKPGITGWAQVNGGKSLSAETKSQFDEWYVRNASLLLDLRILFMTFGFVMMGERHNEEQTARSRTASNAPTLETK